ncbi:MAG: TadE/TadG family type IV pilus assembly protein [Chloroflexota bacterium]|nr:TadE/TadG family type IV pilus assembly protein [Chloroflexota bacterium]
MGNRSERGQVLIEFALTLPVIILILTGIFDLGRAIYAYNAVANAAREGARTGIFVKATDAKIKTAALQTAPGLSLSEEDVTINPSGSRDSGGTVEVTVTYPFQPVTSNLWGGSSIDISSSATMYVE